MSLPGKLLLLENKRISHSLKALRMSLDTRGAQLAAAAVQGDEESCVVGQPAQHLTLHVRLAHLQPEGVLLCSGVNR
jgi:hypothetical protein